MPKDLMEYAKENDIQLLTHNDPKGMWDLFFTHFRSVLCQIVKPNKFYTVCDILIESQNIAKLDKTFQ